MSFVIITITAMWVIHSNAISYQTRFVRTHEDAAREMEESKSFLPAPPALK
jgi:hypothetical protein